MGMTSLEVVKSAIHFQSPDRLPMRFESLGINDTHSVGTNAIAPGDHVGRETYDEWHCLWRRTEMANMGQVKGNPLADWEAIETYRWPDPDDPAYYEGMEGRFAGAGTKYVMTGFFMLLFERMHTLRGMGNVLTELYTDPGRMAFLADRIVAFDLAVIRNIGERFPGRIHGFSFTDDWGTELATFISPRMWCDFFQPRYARLFEAAHAQGWDVWMHTCGRVNEIIEPLIEIGLDCINLQQPRALGIVEIANFRRFVMADIPGLIEGAHAGAGLGDEFLRHVERTRLLVHMMDICPPTGGPADDYRAIRGELAQYSPALAEKPEIVVANKMDLTDADKHVAAFREAIGKDVIAISAVTGKGLASLTEAIWQELHPPQ